MIISIKMLIVLVPFALVAMTALILFRKQLYSRLGARIAALIFASGLLALLMLEAFNAMTSDTASPPWLRLLQIGLVAVGGPVVLGLLTARFVRRPLRQFNQVITSLERSDYKVHLKPTGIREFDEVFTKFNELTERLRHEENLRKDLVSDASHELKTPLTAMIGQLTALQDGKYSLTKSRVSELKDQAERLADLVQQLDAYTKARVADSRAPEDIALRRFCQQVLSHFDAELERRAIRVKLDIADNLSVRGDRDALYKILANFIQNTLRYSEATEITVAATAHQFTFSDNGKGVPSDSLPYLFERFYRVDMSRSRTTGGLGLGLAIVKELAQQQGWHVQAKAMRPGLAFVVKF